MPDSERLHGAMHDSSTPGTDPASDGGISLHDQLAAATISEREVPMALICICNNLPPASADVCQSSLTGWCNSQVVALPLKGAAHLSLQASASTGCVAHQLRCLPVSITLASRLKLPALCHDVLLHLVLHDRAMVMLCRQKVLMHRQ